jgi:pimeloyl-ACP methyl ester carboxylesterase
MSLLEWPGTSFRLETSEEVLADLRARLGRTRLPKDQAGSDWKTGTPLGYAARLRDFWLGAFDWRAWEARINRFEQRMVQLDGQRIHVLVERGSGDRPLPLVMTHGWPGSFMEFIDLIDPLAHPERHGGRVEDAFTVVLPSLPGYGFSPAPVAPLSPGEIASLWSRLMTQAFGFDEYVAYGSDWGSLVTAKLGLDHAERLRALLITTMGFLPTITDDAPLTSEELDWQARADRTMAPESAYQLVQATKPQSLAYGLTDSPIGLACWVIEKFHGWTTPGSSGDPPFSMDALLANVMLYWLGGSVAPMWLYSFLGDFTAPGRRVATPSGFLLAPDDLLVPPPRSFLERSFNVAHYRVAERGGHFPGMDNGDLLVAELREFFGREAASSRSPKLLANP